MDQNLLNVVANELKGGKTPAFISRELKLPYTQIYRIAKSIGYNSTWRDPRFLNTNAGQHPHLKLSVDDILARYDRGERQVDLAKEAGCSREYIRQIVQKHGRIAARVKKKIAHNIKHEQEIKERAQRRVDLEQARIKRDNTRWGKACEMWSNDATLEQIAEAYNLPCNSLAWYVHKLRKKYGWFPFRGAGYHQRLKKDPSLTESRERTELAIAEQMWKEGKTVREIAEAYQADRKIMGWRLWHARHNFGMFPRRISLKTASSDGSSSS